MVLPNKDTSLYAVTGWPLGHTRSPFLHTTLYERTGMNAAYLVLERKPLDFTRSFVHSLRECGFRGFNITLPHKTAVLPWLDRIDRDAAAMGAVNTAKITAGGKLEGYNTDAYGFSKSVSRAFRGLSTSPRLRAPWRLSENLWAALFSRYPRR